MDTQNQITLENYYNKYNLMNRMRQIFLDLNITDTMTSLGIKPQFGIDLLVQMALRKRASVSVLVGLLSHHFSTLQACADALHKAVEHDLLDWDGSLDLFIVRYTIPAHEQQLIDRFQFPLPMLVEPRKIHHNRQNGYFTSTESVLLNKAHHNDDVALDHLNRINKIKYCINVDTAYMVKNQWKNLDKPKPNESMTDYQKRVRAFNKYQTHAYNIIEFLVEEGNEFYLTNRYDKRGRTYSVGYYVNPQGTEWNKAVIQFAEKEYVC